MTHSMRTALDLNQENIFGRESEHVDLGAPPEIDMRDASIFDLISALNDALGRVQEEDLQEIFAEEYTVDFTILMTARPGAK